MKRRGGWLLTLLMQGLLILAIGYAGLVLALPGWLRWYLHGVAGDSLAIGRIRLSPTMVPVLSDVRLDGEPGTFISSERVVVHPPFRLSWSEKTCWIEQLELDRPHLYVRRTQQGTLLPSRVDSLLPGGPNPREALTPPTAHAKSPATAQWRVIIRTIQIAHGTLEFVDQKLAQPFRLALTDLSLVVGPVEVPPRPGQVTFALQSRMVGYQQHTASLYCSGWANLQQQDLDLSCQVKDLQLAAFEPYYQGVLQGRAYDATLNAVMRLVAKANALDGRMQLEIANLSEATLSFFGKTRADLRKIASGTPPTLKGEIQISGALDRPSEWKFQLVPGNEIVERLVKPLLDRGIEIIRIRVGQQTIPVGLTSATEASKADSQAARQQVQEALEIIAPQPPETKPIVETPAPAKPSGEPPRVSSPAGASQPLVSVADHAETGGGTPQAIHPEAPAASTRPPTPSQPDAPLERPASKDTLPPSSH